MYHVLTKSYFPHIAPGQVSKIMMTFVIFEFSLQYTSSSEERVFYSAMKQERQYWSKMCKCCKKWLYIITNFT